MPGPRPKPTAQRIREGNPSHRPLNHEEPHPPPPTAEFDAAPLELADHPDAIAEWSRLAPMLRQAGQVTLADRATLVACCLEWDRYLVALREVHARGLLTK